MVYITYAGVEYELPHAGSATHAKEQIERGLSEGGVLWLDAYWPEGGITQRYVELLITPGVPAVIRESGV